MRTYDPAHIRNVALLAHGGAGKTSLSEAILFSAGAITRQGKVTEGTTTSDFEPEETKRHISINLSLLPCEWKGHKLNVLDTPGYADFVGEVVASLRAADSAAIVVDAAAGVEVGTEQVWQLAERLLLPRMVVVNKMDRENADFARTLDQVQSVLGKRCVPVQVPIGAQSEFTGVVDLVRMRAYLGTDSEEKDIPDALAGPAQAMREKLVEAVAELNDDLIAKYLEGTELTQEEIATGVREGTKNGKLVPVVAVSGVQNKGVARFLDVVIELLPSPVERGKAKAKGNGSDVELAVDPSGPLAALVFKTTADPYVGKLTYFRVFSGTFRSNSQVWNAPKSSDERIGQVFTVRGKTQEPVPQVVAGDIGAVSKLSATGTGDTLCTKEKPLVLAPIEFPQPSIGMSVRPTTKADLDKMSQALPRLVEEDPTLKVRRDADTGETVLWGMGENHLDVAAEKLHRKFGAGVTLDVPRVPYRETITVKTESEYKHKKQTGGHGQYGHVLLRLEPLKRGEGFKFESAVVGGSVPRNFIPAVEKGVNEGRHEGVMAGYPLVDVKVVLYDGSYHDVDSSEMAFKIASAQALKKGLADARPVLLEPILNLRVVAPEEFTGDVISDLNTKRARVQGMNRDGKSTIVEAQAPQAELLRYAVDLRSMTQGRASFTTEFSHYEEVPSFIAQKVAADRQAQKQAEKEEK
ncbi:MAG: elongation factor G [Chloroflexi bacterium]|nr:elongation factor G [Chloroflexota bacterium]